jgi:hypothetical protein
MKLAPQAPAVEAMRDAHKAAREMGACLRRQPMRSIHQHTYVSIRQHTSAAAREMGACLRRQPMRSIRQHTYVSIRQHTSAAAREMGACLRRQPMRTHMYCQQTSAYVCQHTSAYVSIRQQQPMRTHMYWRKHTYIEYSTTISMCLLIPLIVEKWGRA